MKTLIELFDQRPLENILAADVFRPERIVYICPEDFYGNIQSEKVIRQYFAHRRIDIDIVFMKTSVMNADSVEEKIKEAVEEYPECVLDITGGTDAALFAAGRICAKQPISVFTYSRKRNFFYEIQNSEFGKEIPCHQKFSIQDCLIMAGGQMRTGRVDNEILGKYRKLYGPFFNLYMRYRSEWVGIVSYLQRMRVEDGIIAQGDWTLKAGNGKRTMANPEAMKEMEKIGLIRNLCIKPEQSVSFEYRDSQIGAWLRDIGSVLELYTYQQCRNTGVYQDVRTSVIVGWELTDRKVDAVSNEIDVVATSGVVPVFISCKTCEVKTEALNELAILRDRFGGEMAKAAVVTTQKGNSRMRQRAHELGIDVIDLIDLKEGRLRERLKRLVQTH